MKCWQRESIWPVTSIWPIRTNTAKCRENRAEFDEFQCVSVYVYESYLEGRQNLGYGRSRWISIQKQNYIYYIIQKVYLPTDYLLAKEVGVIGEKLPDLVDLRRSFAIDIERNNDDLKPCRRPNQIKFDERYCIASTHLAKYKKFNTPSCEPIVFN